MSDTEYKERMLLRYVKDLINASSMGACKEKQDLLDSAKDFVKQIESEKSK